MAERDQETSMDAAVIEGIRSAAGVQRPVEKRHRADQRRVNYRPAEGLETSCGTCEFGIGSGTTACALVDGIIRPDYLCDLYREAELPDPDDLMDDPAMAMGKTRRFRKSRDLDLGYEPITKSDEHRYTFGPMYVPDALDAHGEFVLGSDLQKAVWQHNLSADRDLRLQHQPDIVAGREVEMATWPYEATVKLHLPGEDVAKEVTLPAGTPYLGAVWEPWAFRLVKSGKLRGYSMGGRARRISVDFDGVG